MPPVRLTDAELSVVLNACRPLQPCDRDQFLKDIAAELASLPMLGPGAVHRVIATVQRKHWDPPDLSRARDQSRWR
jgi:hypothetical protein